LNVYNIQQDADAIQRDINNLDYLNAVTDVDVVNNQELRDYNEAVNLNNINAGIAAIDRQEAANTELTDYATRQANYVGAQNDRQKQLEDFYAANPNYPRYGEEYGQGITSVIPDVAPNVFPVTGGGTDYGGGGNYDYGDAYIPDVTPDVAPNVTPNVTPDVSSVTDNSGYGTGVLGFDYNPDPYVGVHYDDAANRYAQEMTQANDSSNFLNDFYGISGGGGFGGGVGGGKSDDGDYEVSAMARGGIASLPKSPGQKLLAAHRAGDMAAVHRMLKKVRR
jgi:hypothetical protein